MFVLLNVQVSLYSDYLVKSDTEFLENSKLKISDPQYVDQLKSIEQKRIRRTKQYYGEGGTFLLIILLSAGIVYYAYYRQLKLSQLLQPKDQSYAPIF